MLEDDEDDDEDKENYAEEQLMDNHVDVNNKNNEPTQQPNEKIDWWRWLLNNLLNTQVL